MKILLTSTSSHKIDAVKKVFDPELLLMAKINNPVSQPLNYISDSNCLITEAKMWAYHRISTLPDFDQLKTQFDLIISIENGFISIPLPAYDICEVIIYDCHNSNFLHATSDITFQIDHDWYVSADFQILREINATFGEHYAKKNKSASSANWMEHYHSVSRTEQIINGLRKCESLLRCSIVNHIKQTVEIVSDFPRKGINFVDMNSIFTNQKLVDQILDHFISLIESDCLAKEFDSMSDITIVSPETKGCMWGILLANRLKCNFVPIRKEGKLPPKFIQKSYTKRDGKNNLHTLEIKDNPLDTVVIIDDVIGTGESMKTCIELVEELGGNIIEIFSIIDVPYLRESAKKNICQISNINYKVLWQEPDQKSEQESNELPNVVINLETEDVVQI